MSIESAAAVQEPEPAPGQEPDDPSVPPRAEHDPTAQQDGSDQSGDPLFGSGLRYSMGWNRHDDAMRSSLRGILRRLPELAAICVRLSWRADRRAFVLLTACELATGAFTAFGLLATNGVLTALLAGGPTPGRVRAALPAIGLVAASSVATALLSALARAASGRLKPRVQRLASSDLLARAIRVELITFEQADYHDVLEAAQYGAGWTETVIEQLTAVATALMAVVAATGVLGILHPLLLVLLPLVVLPRGWAVARSAQRRNVSRLERLPKLRQQSRLSDLLTSERPAEEVRLHDAGTFLLAQYNRLAAENEAEDARLARAAAGTDLTAGALTGAATVLTYAVLGLLVLRGTVPIAAAGTAVLAIRTGTGQLGSLVRAASAMFEYGLYVADWRDACLLSTRHAIPPPRRPEEVLAPRVIRAEGVRFRYPNAAAPALDGVDITIEAGRIVAFVGHNGSGKTTLAKVLAGLYLPDEGAVTWDGVPTSELDRDGAFANVALLSQDFERWPFTAHANVAVGRHTRTPDPSSLASAAGAADAEGLIADLPHGWRTLLAPEHQGGVDLSGGQWQKIALARAYFRDAPVLILDEPTASLDPRAEAATFDGVRRLAGGRTVLLITHRLHSVRHADAICVLANGRVIEYGTHDALMTANGEYADLYQLQARQFSTGTR